MAPSVAPKQGDKLTWNGMDYEIVSFKEYKPALVVVLYEAQLRGNPTQLTEE